MIAHKPVDLLRVVIILSGTCGIAYGQDGLALECELYRGEVLERCPVVAKLTVRNTSDTTIQTIFPLNDVELIAIRASLMLRDEQGRLYVLRYRGGPIAEYPAPIADHGLPPGALLSIDRLFSLVVRTPAPPRWAGRVSERYKFLEPGSYTGHVEVALLGSEKLISNEIELTILEAVGFDKESRDQIQFRHVGFFEGRDPPLKESHYKGGKTRYGVDLTRFKEVQHILDNYPDSAHAEWIRFWKLYHHGPFEDALRYAREHRDFALSDNLILRMAEKLFNQAGNYDRATYNRARELVVELLRDFPDGDARARTEVLQAKLTNKP